MFTVKKMGEDINGIQTVAQLFPVQYNHDGSVCPQSVKSLCNQSFLFSFDMNNIECIPTRTTYLSLASDANKLHLSCGKNLREKHKTLNTSIFCIYQLPKGIAQFVFVLGYLQMAHYFVSILHRFFKRLEMKKFQYSSPK